MTEDQLAASDLNAIRLGVEGRIECLQMEASMQSQLLFGAPFAAAAPQSGRPSSTIPLEKQTKLTPRLFDAVFKGRRPQDRGVATRGRQRR